MKLIIEIPEEVLKTRYYTDYFGCGSHKLTETLDNATPIPDNDCNSCEKAWTDKCERAECYENNYKHWTPYQKGSK